MKKILLTLITIGSIAHAATQSWSQRWQQVKQTTKEGLGRLKENAQNAALISEAITYAVTLGVKIGDINKTMTLLEAAGIQPTHPNFKTIVSTVGLLGSYGKNKTEKVIHAALKKNAITIDQAIDILWPSKQALALYWNVSDSTFFWTSFAIRSGLARNALNISFAPRPTDTRATLKALAAIKVK